MAINIRRHKQRKVPTLNMASMPDLIFTVLFFFMIVTHMRTESPKLQVKTPEGTQLTQPANKRALANLYIGTDKHGETHIQVGDDIISLEKVGVALIEMRNRSEAPEDFTINIRADKNTPMGVINDVKQELRKNGLLMIRYNAAEKKKEHLAPNENK